MSQLALREFHSFQAAGKDFVYLVPSAAVFELDDSSAAVINRLRVRDMSRDDLAQQPGGLVEPADLDHRRGTAEPGRRARRGRAGAHSSFRFFR